MIEAPIVVDSLEGQAHFFPAISNTKQLKRNFEKFGVNRLPRDGKVDLQMPSKVVL